MPDLINNARAKFNLPSATSADDATINTLIAAASQAIQRHCRRDFAVTAYDELYNGTGERRLLLRQYPLLAVQSVRYRPVTVLKIINSNIALNQQARVSVTGTGLSLVRTASGVAASDTVTFAGNVTLTALAGAINALGNGWAAQVVGDYGPWPAADLRAPQGALTACGQFAELKMHTVELAGYQLDERRGWLLRAIPYTDPELLHPEDLVWPVGVNNFRVQYTAGYATVPEDVQEACAELVATWFAQRGRDLSLHSEDTAGTYRYTAEANQQLPRRVRALLRPYRYHTVATNQG
ncbi:hypothetical protein AYO44_10505 [Planctomycetaceae bacterium SCGC AG-212-F19]|nr:hypothetical protein AYO44_10505 [Planctomycetaceae bacterium SCGC AG-212-F19]